MDSPRKIQNKLTAMNDTLKIHIQFSVLSPKFASLLRRSAMRVPLITAMGRLLKRFLAILFGLPIGYKRICFAGGSGIILSILSILPTADKAIGASQDPIIPAYTFVGLDVPDPIGGLGSTILNDIADNGDIVGSFPAAPNAPAFLLERLHIAPIPVCADARFIAPAGINNRGEVSGSCIFPSTQGFIRGRKGEFVLLNVPGAASTRAQKLNDHSDVVGTYQDSGGISHGFIWSHGIFHNVDIPQGQTFPNAINNLGHIVGYYTGAAGQQHGFIRYRDGSVGLVDFPEAQSTIPSDINDDGHIVGTYRDSQGRNHTFLFRIGSFFTVDPPFASTANLILQPGINQGDEIVSAYNNSSGFHGFVGTLDRKSPRWAQRP